MTGIGFCATIVENDHNFVAALDWDNRYDRAVYLETGTTWVLAGYLVFQQQNLYFLYHQNGRFGWKSHVWIKIEEKGRTFDSHLLCLGGRRSAKSFVRQKMSETNDSKSIWQLQREFWQQRLFQRQRRSKQMNYEDFKGELYRIIMQQGDVKGRKVMLLEKGFTTRDDQMLNMIRYINRTCFGIFLSQNISPQNSIKTNISISQK